LARGRPVAAPVTTVVDLEPGDPERIVEVHGHDGHAAMNRHRDDHQRVGDAPTTDGAVFSRWSRA
jgi:hypothetical protein